MRGLLSCLPAYSPSRRGAVIVCDGTAQWKSPRDDPRVVQRWAPLGHTALSRSGLGANRVMASGVHPGAIGAHLCGRGYLPFLSFLSFFLPANLVS